MKICALKRQGRICDVLLLLEHPTTITLGRNGKWRHLLAAENALQSLNVRCFEADRGGDITFHGPGQLVGYPLLELEAGERDVRRLMHNLEECLIRVVAAYGIKGFREENHIGVWTDRGKIAAMGIHISRWITRHGFALNVNTDLAFYDLIIPCGISGKFVTSMESFLSRRCELREIAEKFTQEFGPTFQRNMIWLSESALRGKL